jgi:hypothetical protein
MGPGRSPGEALMDNDDRDDLDDLDDLDRLRRDGDSDGRVGRGLRGGLLGLGRLLGRGRLRLRRRGLGGAFGAACPDQPADEQAEQEGDDDECEGLADEPGHADLQQVRCV